MALFEVGSPVTDADFINRKEELPIFLQAAMNR